MIRSSTVLVGALLISMIGVGCDDDSPTSPGVPVFLSGVWRGTMTLHVADQPPVEGDVSCLFTPLSSETESRASAACSVESDWLTTSFGGDLTLDDAEPPTDVQLETTYTSPRGCVGSLRLDGEATASRVSATMEGVDCDDLPWSADLLLAEAR